MGLRLYQPYRLPVRLSLWLAWAAIALGVVMIGSRNPVPNHPVGLLLLGLGLTGSSLLAALTLFIPAIWQRLIEPGFDSGEARKHLYGVMGLGLIGLPMLWLAVGRLL